MQRMPSRLHAAATSLPISPTPRKPTVTSSIGLKTQYHHNKIVFKKAADSIILFTQVMAILKNAIFEERQKNYRVVSP